MSARRWKEIERALRTVAWAAHGADQAMVGSALRRLWVARSEQESQDAYNLVLDAIGDNHSGWLCDAAGPAAAILAAIVRAAHGWPLRTAMEVLIDCLAWVRPDQRFLDADGQGHSVEAALRDAVKGLESDLRVIANDTDTTVPVAKSAKDLLEALHEAAG